MRQARSLPDFKNDALDYSFLSLVPPYSSEVSFCLVLNNYTGGQRWKNSLSWALLRLGDGKPCSLLSLSVEIKSTEKSGRLSPVRCHHVVSAQRGTLKSSAQFEGQTFRLLASVRGGKWRIAGNRVSNAEMQSASAVSVWSGRINSREKGEAEERLNAFRKKPTKLERQLCCRGERSELHWKGNYRVGNFKMFHFDGQSSDASALAKLLSAQVAKKFWVKNQMQFLWDENSNPAISFRNGWNDLSSRKPERFRNFPAPTVLYSFGGTARQFYTNDAL